MLIHSACPHCHNPCTWSDTSESEYVRCAHCEKLFVISDWGIARLPHRRPRRRSQGMALWPWLLFAVVTCGIIAGGSLLQRAQRAAKLEPRVTPESFQRLRVGMKELEVIQVLGLPTRIDKSIVPQIHAHAAHRFTVAEEEFPQRYFWEDGDNLIWIDMLQGRAQKFGATLEGEQIGDNPMLPLVKELQDKGE